MLDNNKKRLWATADKLRSITLILIAMCLCFTVNAEDLVEIYRSDTHRFAITPPINWTKEESTQPGRFSVRFINKRGSLSVVVKSPSEPEKMILTLVRNRSFSDAQLLKLSDLLYGQNPAVLGPRLITTKLANEPALMSVYDFRLDTLGLSQYVAVLKIETIKDGQVYRVEATGPAAKTVHEAGEAMKSVLSELNRHIQTFVFLPR